ncbi:MAG: carboxylesterase family protein [Lachnospiraceae bacterium]|nr:carboxylesterase family protein [Lachnospiraceae bacterium]
MKKRLGIFSVIIVLFIVIIATFTVKNNNKKAKENKVKKSIANMYGTNQEITGNYDSDLAVKCINGTFVGTQEEDVQIFKGIPFAKQPVGELRWKEPEEAEPSDKIYEAFYYGRSCIQTEVESERASYYPKGEDCLNLNIWRNVSDEDTDKPVMVFIHGGGYGWGGTTDPLYDATKLVEKYPDIIVVTISYRLGMFGFMDFSRVEGGEKYIKSGNLGLLDQVMALRWVHDNISGFGGDPENVTIWGESAGAGSVSLLPMVEGSEGLFNKIIAESGSLNFTSSRKECQEFTKMVLKESGCKNMDELAGLSEEEITKLNEKVNDYINFPERDGVVLPDKPYEFYENGGGKGISILIGTNMNESNYWINEMSGILPGVSGYFLYRNGAKDAYENILNNFSDEDRAKVEEYFDNLEYASPWNYSEMFNEIVFRIPSIKLAEEASLQGQNVYMYYWEYPSALKHMGACHAVELAYVFNNLTDTIYTGNDINTNLANVVQDMWVNFARTGDPGTDDYEWKTYDTTERNTMILGDKIRNEKDPLSEGRKYISPTAGYYVSGAYEGVLEKVIGRIIVIELIALAVIILMVVIGLNIRRRLRKKRINKVEGEENSEYS